MGFGQHHPGALGEQLGRCRQVLEQERRERLGALDEQPVGQALQLIREPVGVLVRHLGGARAQGVVGDQLPDGRHVDERHLLGGELAGRGELAQRLDLVAPVLQADRPARRAREDIDHAAAHGELPAMFDDVGARVPEVHQPVGERVGRELHAGHQLERGRGARGSGSPPASPRGRGRPARTGPGHPGAGAGPRPGARRPPAPARCPRTAGPPTAAGARPAPRRGRRRHRRPGRRPRAGPA